jgi:hypothetical protein
MAESPRSMTAYSTTAIALFASLFATSVAAEPANTAASDAYLARGIALEAHVGAPTAMTAVVGPVLRELERRGFVSRPMSIRKLLGGRAPLPGILDRGMSADDIAALSDRGFDAFTQAEYKDAVAALATAVELIKRNPGLDMLDTGHAHSAFRAFVGLALSQSKLGDIAGSTETIIELIRTFSTQAVDRAEYGPEAQQLYSAAQKQVQGMVRGKLVVTVDDPRARVFVNSALRARGAIALSGLIPGTYRIFVQVPDQEGRQYQIEVRADETSKLDVEWRADAALTISETWAGFAFASEADQARAPVYAGALTREWHQDAIVVVDVAELQGEQALIGTVYRRDGSVIRNALVVPGDDPTKLYALASFLADGTPSSELRLVPTASPHAVRTGEASSSERRSTRRAWPFFAVGATAIVAGIGLMVVDQDRGQTAADGSLPAHYRDTAPFGVAAGLTGAACIGAGLWLSRGQPQRLPSVSLGTSGVVVRWSTQF